MSNQELFNRLTALQNKMELLKYKKQENEKKKTDILKELDKSGITTLEQLKANIESEEKNIVTLEGQFSESLTKVESMAKDLEDKISGKVPAVSL